ncbi:PadR family transcriptional regulator [Mumia sp. ZJ1417]|uniref:PadR family transcriptional regulator n=1 Tax=Mumia sp. ZJ1417 TaxID=2708082 RepID=UPI00142275D0|nr:PadR family transcriptional regulator [Mumia sp. ZJ1417]QMW67225.1 PadR family transcriptional regulator [Mumia sp. ZJ1417]
MPTNALHSKLSLPALGLLLEQADHPYGLTSRLNDRYRHLHASRSSITTLAKSLADADLVTPRSPERVGNRPPRTIYDLTEAGFTHMRHRVEETIRTAPAMDADFVTALAYIGLLGKERAEDALDERTRRIRQEIADLSDSPTDLAEIKMIEVEYWLRMLASEASWLEQLRDRIESGEIEWIGDKPSCSTASMSPAARAQPAQSRIAPKESPRPSTTSQADPRT